jgi:uncharacterized protein
MSSRVLKAAMAIALAAGLGACRDAPETVTLSVASQSLTVEVARTAVQREHGLMGRRDLGPRDGMIFLFDRDQHLAFWMKDTPTALSIAFVATDGRITQISDMEAFSEAITESVHSVRYALEMRKGAYADLGIKEGDVITFPAGFPGTARIEP